MPKTTRRPARSRRPTPDRETEHRILDAARAVFIRRGTAGARMQEIAREAGVNQALLHYYFRSKERLSTAVFQQFAIRILPALIQILGDELPLDTKIDRIVALYLENLSRNPFLPGYLLSELHHHPERVKQLLAIVAGGEPARVVAPAFRKIDAQIGERVRGGTMRHITATQFVVNLLALCVFPFAARPMIATMFGMDDAEFARFIEERRREVPEFFRNALRP